MSTKTTIKEHENTFEKVGFFQLAEIEEQTTEIMILVNQVKSLMYFMHQFFSVESIDLLQEDEEAHNKALMNVFHYPHYRELFYVMSQNIDTLKESTETAMNSLESLFDLLKM